MNTAVLPATARPSAISDEAADAVARRPVCAPGAREGIPLDAHALATRRSANVFKSVSSFFGTVESQP